MILEQMKMCYIIIWHVFFYLNVNIHLEADATKRRDAK